MDFFPIHIILPSSTPEEYINQLATYIIDIMKITPSVIPSLGYDDKTKNALIKIAELLRRATKKNPLLLSPVSTPTPTLPHIYLPVESQRVTVPPVLPPVPSQWVPVSKLTLHQRMQK